ncbi:ribonuclease III domain-containing protein [Clohesyomyces aquaticus]|uniref:Ribonuclease III domain-containing protein n=1 Tax=Clohesyomyces aquaticus TaxID=1231657 RepID=A0A1Y1ZUR6_9PLEO|nr:ribonuclease III domain-containing protein [Clohesyomyces aquaticus]
MTSQSRSAASRLTSPSGSLTTPTPSSPITVKLLYCEAILGHTFTDKTILLEALQMDGGLGLVPYNDICFQIPKNKRLAIVGDATLDHVLSLEWWKSGRDEGSWTSLRSTLTSNSALETRGKSLGLHNCILMNPGTLYVSMEMMARTMEALIGAVRCDGGDVAAERAMRKCGFMEEMGRGGKARM